MLHVSYTDLRARLAHWMDRANDDRAPILVTRQGAEAVVMMALSEYEGMLETLHLRSSPINAQRLDESIAQANAGNLIEVVWDEATQAYKPL